jgi:hypothetical protein
MKRLLALLFLLPLIALAQGATVTATATLSWTAVTTSTTGGTITGVTYNVWGSNIAAGGTCTTTGMTQLASALSALTYVSTQSGLTPGALMCFAVTASAGGQVSAFSNVVNVVVPTPPPAVPNQPTQLTVTVVFVSSP